MRTIYPRRQNKLTPLPIGHRGLLDQAPENTVPSFLAAKKLGVPIVEFDVRLSRDRQVVVFHDSDLKRIAGIDRNVSELQYETLRQIDLGRWFSPQFAGEMIPNLAEVLDVFLEYTWLLIELKEDEPDLIQQVCEMVERKGFVQNTMLQSFHEKALKLAKEFNPRLHRVLLTYDIPPWSVLESGIAEAISVHINQVSLQNLEPFFKENIPVHAWPVDTEEHLSLCVDLGIDCIGTNKTSFIKQLMSQMENR